MKETVAKIRELLDALEANKPTEEPSFKESFQLFELPEIVSDIVDFLQPALQPYEVAIYWYMFRQSIIATGDVYVRVSVEKLRVNIHSMQEGVEVATRKSISDKLKSLTAKAVITIAGDTTNKGGSTGTLYRVYLPEEIAFCREAMSRAQKEQLPKIDPKRELDFYNIKENRLKVFERDKYLCHYCQKQLTRFSATLDHIQPVSKGGDNSYDNLVTACLLHNSQRGSQPIMDFITRKREEPN